MKDQYKLYGTINNICKNCKYCLNAANYCKRATNEYHCSKFRDKADGNKTRVKVTDIACGKFEVKE